MDTMTTTTVSVSAARLLAVDPIALRARGLRRTVRGRVLLDDVDLDVATGAFVAIAGPSGAGKSTLLRALAGLDRPSTGSVERHGPDHPIGFVPQEDIIHRDLALRTTLRYAARLRLPTADRAVIDAAVDDVLAVLGLEDQRDVRVGSLSGGQRKRASIAVELLTDPPILLLDEPTSGLDPISALGVVRALRGLAASGVTVVMTTHDPAQLDLADQVVFVAPGGRLAFAGTPGAARTAFDVSDLVEVYDRLAWPAPHGARPTMPTAPLARDRAGAAKGRSTSRPRPRPAVAMRRWAVLTRRTAALLVANRLTVAVLVGSPVLVIAMMAVLFPADAFTDPIAAATLAPQILFWMAFAGFFFGLTYGLLQIVTERDIVRRERASGIGTRTYLAAKLGVLVPTLAVVCTALLVVLATTDRLPDLDRAAFGALLGTLVLEATAALALGMLASAAVRDAAQATLALPLLCFPQVLFAGAVVPLATMSGLGQALSVPLATRWSFEALGRSLPTGTVTEGAATAYPEVFAGSPARGLAVLVVATVVCLALVRRLLDRS